MRRVTGGAHPPESQRRQVTVVFADVSGFTAMSSRMDPEDVATIMQRCFRLMEAVVRERGGTVDKFIGDCVMALFGAPRAIENAPRLALLAALEIRDQIDALAREGAIPG